MVGIPQVRDGGIPQIPLSQVDVVTVALHQAPEPQTEVLPPDASPEAETLSLEPETAPSPAPVPEKSDRQAFFDLNFNELGMAVYRRSR